jgi:hypothetical protein
MNKTITIMGISTIALFLVVGCTQEGQEPGCGNQICESGEDGFTCPRDCCVDGDGVCRDGCTPAIDDDCKAKTIQDLAVGIHLESTRDFGDDAYKYIKKAVDDVGSQLISRGWSGHGFTKYSEYSDWFSHTQAANDAGAFFGAWQSVARIKREFGGQDDLLTSMEFNDYTTRGADGKSYYTGDKWTYDSAIANESFLDYMLTGTYAQIDAGANAIHYDEMSGGEYFLPEGKVGYDDYAIGIADFCEPCSVNPIATADSHSGNYIPANAIDGDISTYWVSNEGTDLHWLEVDFSTNRTVRQVSLSLDTERLLTSYEIQYHDGTNWINLVTETDNTYEYPSYMVGPVYTTKIRLYTTQNPAVVAEFRAFGQGFRQYLIGKYGEDYDWEGEFNIDLTPGGKQCPDGTINYFNYREYLADNGWSGHEPGGSNPRGSDEKYYPPANPLHNEFGCPSSPPLRLCSSYTSWTDTKLGSCDPGIGKCAQSFIPSADEEILSFCLYLKTDGISSDYIVEIQSDNDDSPSGEILGSVILSSSLLGKYSTGGRYMRSIIPLFTVAKGVVEGGVIVKSGKKYWIVVRASDEIPNELLWQGSGDKVGAMRELQGVWTTQPGGLFYEVQTLGYFLDASRSFRLNREKQVKDYIFEHTREYGATEDKTVYVTANGITPSSDYNDAGIWDLPTDDPSPNPHLDGDQVWISRWRLKKTVVQRFSDVPTMMFLDYGFDRLPFAKLATQAEREAFLRTYVPEIYASGLLFSYPVKSEWFYKAYEDWNAQHTSTIYDVIVKQGKFFSTHFSIYKDALIDPLEEDVKVKVGEKWITPSDTGKANEAKVSIALMNAKDGDKTYLHVINHNWNSDTHSMNKQTDIEMFVPLPSDADITNIDIVSPDFSGKVSINWISKDNGVYITLPSLMYYNIVAMEIN